MRIAVGADHKGFPFKEKIKAMLTAWGHDVFDCGTDSEESVDYPDFGLKVAHAVADHVAEYGVTICWTGNGMNMAANKVNGVRAGMALNVEMAELTRLHNDANVLTLAAKYTPEGQIEDILKVFLDTKFEGGRHMSRIDKMMAEESN
ncbi:MAG: ribose 5-phosphate isomerase B [candidate division Zixibacteria bacterium]|nr:ribose 5-phosphate isomerase B [candidate division Zixibacteria bacterium]